MEDLRRLEDSYKTLAHDYCILGNVLATLQMQVSRTDHIVHYRISRDIEYLRNDLESLSRSSYLVLKDILIKLNLGQESEVMRQIFDPEAIEDLIYEDFTLLINKYTDPDYAIKKYIITAIAEFRIKKLDLDLDPKLIAKPIIEMI